MTAIMPAAPIANLPDWVRPWPGDAAPDGDRLTWWSDLATAASKANKPHLGNFASASALLIGAGVQQREIARLRVQCKSLETQLAESPHDRTAQQLVDAVDKRSDERAKARFNELQLRDEQHAAAEDALTADLGELKARVGEQDRLIARLFAEIKALR